MKKPKIKSIKKAFNNIKKYNKTYGLGVSLRVFRHYLFRAIKNYSVNPNESIVTINGYKMFTVPNDPGISTELSVFKTHEPINTKIIPKLLQKGMTCIDIGGNIGYYVLLERKIVGDKGKIIAIEPLPQNFSYLNKNIQLHNFENISTFNFACGDKNGEATFFVNKKSNGCQVIREGVEPPDPSLGTLSKVSIKKLDTLVSELNLKHVDFVRMDAEGYELHILRGFKSTLEKFRPIISLELHKRQLGVDGTLEFFKLMKDLDYEIASYIPRELDIPIIGSMKNVTTPSIDELISMVKFGKTSNYLMLNLIPKNKFQ